MVEDNVLIALLQEERPPVFFLIGSQRSGSNWLFTMISESKVIATPHPPHILKSFMPILDKFGNLFQEDNMRALVDHVCEFVEKNPVPWVTLTRSGSFSIESKSSSVVKEALYRLLQYLKPSWMCLQCVTSVTHRCASQ